MRKFLVVSILLLWTVISTPLYASPLYGGYNGQSGSWVDLFFFGIDDQAHWWVRIPVVLEGGALRVQFKYESTGAVSAEIVVRGLTEQGDFLFGIDTTNVTWQELYELTLSGGSDSNGNAWSEQSIFNFLGTGSDSSENVWGFIGTYIEKALPVRAGMDLAPPVAESLVALDHALLQKRRSPLCLLNGLLKKEERITLIHFLASLSLDEELGRGVETLARSSLSLESLLRFADEEVFTQERREAIELALDGLMRE